MRKKFTMLLAALLACVGVAKADVTDLPQITTDLENPIYYTIYNTRSSQPGGLMYWAGDEVGMKDGCTSLTLGDKYKFFFTGSHDALYVHNAATTKKLASVGNGDKAKGSWTDEGTVWAVGVSPKGGGLAFGPKDGLNGNSCWNECNYNTGDGNPDFTTWSANDAGSIFVVELAENFVAPISDLFYVIECPLFENVQGVKKALYVNNEGKAVWGTEDLTNNNFYWIPTVNQDGTVALKNFGTNTYLSAADGTMTAGAANATLNALGNNSFSINIGGTLHAGGHNSGNGVSGSLTSWEGAAGSASAWSFVQKNDPTASQEVVVKYSFTYGGEEKYTQEVNTLVGEEWPAITASFPYGVSSATKPAGEVTAEGAVEGVVTKTIELAVNLPFTYASDYASIENWYYINIHTAGYYLNYEEGAESMDLTATAVPTDQKDAYTWAFIGNPFDGYQIVNKAAGESMILSSSTTMAGNNGSGTYPIMTNTPVTEGHNTLWFATASTHRTNGFYLEQSGFSANKMNRRDGKLAYWTTGKDAGSTFMVELRDDSEQLKALVNSANEILTNLGEGTAVGCVTAESKADVVAAIASANTAIENKAGYEAAEIALQAAINALETIQPEAGKFYTIQNAYSNVYMGVGNAGGMVSENAAAIGEVFQFVAAEDDKFYLYNVERGSYLSSAPGHGWGQASATATETSNAKAVAIANLGLENRVSIIPVGGAALHHDANYGTIVGWNGDANSRSAWKIVEVDVATLAHAVAVTEAGWSTLTLGYNATIPAGVTAYAVSEIDGKYAKLTEVTGVIPAGEAVLLNAEAGTYEFKYAESAEPVASNLLEGTVFNTNVAEVAYVLAAKNGVGLYKAAYNVSTDTTNDGEEGVEDDTYEAFLNNAFKAYLPAPANAAAPMFSLERGEGTTAIDSVELTNGNVVIYDLAGRRVEKMEKGIYIVNGKKVIR
ncbi:MAG: hypothetical protein IKL03_07900 [Bacteroidaceae bacterium]|nr:hypothetical protein [Bacteroidaceae bacterium]